SAELVAEGGVQGRPEVPDHRRRRVGAGEHVGGEDDADETLSGVVGPRRTETPRPAVAADRAGGRRPPDLDADTETPTLRTVGRGEGWRSRCRPSRSGRTPAPGGTPRAAGRPPGRSALRGRRTRCCKATARPAGGGAAGWRGGGSTRRARAGPAAPGGRSRGR